MQGSKPVVRTANKSLPFNKTSTKEVKIVEKEVIKPKTGFT
jgi:hypothetical protein